MRRFRWGLVLALSLGLALTIATPAQTATTISLRYWPTSVSASTPAGEFGNWSTGFFTLSTRLDPGGPWAFSFNGSWGAQSNWGGTWSAALSGNDSIYSFNIHRKFGPAGQFSLYAGYYNAGWTTDFSPEQSWRASGFHLGADANIPMGAWTVGAWAQFSVSGSGTFSFGASSETASASFSDYGIVLSRPFGAWNLDLGYRWASLGEGASASTVCPCTYDWTGFVIGLGKTF